MSDSAPTASSREEMDEMRREISSLRAQLSSLDNHSVTNEAAPGLPDRTAEEQSELDARMARQHAALLRARLDSESDSDWGVDSVANVSRRFEELDSFGAHLDSVRCGETLCELGVTYADELARTMFEREFVFTEDAQFEGGASHLEGSTSEGRQFVVFLGRPGFPLPPPEPVH
ncbi:MAG: hypothetical protein AB7S26_36760 [Sandaracinaceae bacterium]